MKPKTNDEIKAKVAKMADKEAVEADEKAEKEKAEKAEKEAKEAKEAKSKAKAESVAEKKVTKYSDVGDDEFNKS